MDFKYHKGQRSVQERFDSVRLANRLVEKTYQSELDEGDIAFIGRQRMFFLATVDPEGEPYCTFRGGDPGFVRVLDPVTLAWPEFNGNGMFLALGNIQERQLVHLLFVDFEDQKRFRVAGVAETLFDQESLDEFYGTQSVVKVHIQRAFPNCKRYIPKMALVEPARHVPRPTEVTPVAAWKRSEWACDCLPASDPALDPSRPEW